MRRIALKHAKPGMVLGRPVYDSYGYEVVERGTEIGDDLLRKLEIFGVAELVVRDWRVEDVPVHSLFPPELEGRAARALQAIITECQGTMEVDDSLLEDAEDPVLQMTRELYPEAIGEVNASGCLEPNDYYFIQPARTAGLCLLMGRRLGLGMAALLKDIGIIGLPGGLMDLTSPSEAQVEQARRHPLYSAQVLGRHTRFSPEVISAIAHHHERWDGSGYPGALRGEAIPLYARVIAIADVYYELVSARPGRGAYMPHEAVEYIMAYSGELFDPALVTVFTRHVPLYPTGVTVKLNTGETGIVSDSNPGIIGRPVVRICFDEGSRPVREPYDLNLAETENQGRLIVQVLEY